MTTTDIAAKAVKEADRTGGRPADLVTAAATNSTRVPPVTKGATAVKAWNMPAPRWAITATSKTPGKAGVVNTAEDTKTTARKAADTVPLRWAVTDRKAVDMNRGAADMDRKAGDTNLKEAATVRKAADMSQVPATDRNAANMDRSVEHPSREAEITARR